MTYEELSIELNKHFECGDDKIELLKKYAHILIETNKVMNLTAIKEEEEIVLKHFYDSLIPTFDSHFSCGSMLDIGSGAGFPGMVIAIIFPQIRVTCLDATAKRCKFLETVRDELELKNVYIINSRAEDLKKREHFDLVTARAVTNLPMLLEITTPFAKVGGTVLAMKGEKGREELLLASPAIEALNLEVEEIQSTKLYNEDDTRINIFFKKVKKTSKQFPREWKDIKNKPLSI